MLAKYVQIFVFVKFSATIIRHISTPVAIWEIIFGMCKHDIIYASHAKNGLNA